MLFSRFAVFAVLAVGMVLTSDAQQPEPKASTSASTAQADNDFVQQQFGTTCSLVAGPPAFTADLDGDGVLDAVIVARCGNPLMDQTERSYQVVDPYNSFYGFGNPKITTQFASEDPHGRGLSLLIIHGAGPEAWHSTTPKAKFLVINLPFKEIAVKKLARGKKNIMAIYAKESGEGDGTVSVVFWDGKKYKYQPIGSSME
jgi:hypothetical protein